MPRIERLFSTQPLRGSPGVFDPGGPGFAEGAAQATRQIRGASRRAFASQQAALDRQTSALVDRGEAVRVLGDAVTGAGGDLVDIGVELNRRETEGRRETAFATARREMLVADDNARREAKKPPEPGGTEGAAPDGSDYEPRYLERFDKRMSEVVQSAADDPELSRAISIMAGEIRTRGQLAIRRDAHGARAARELAELDANLADLGRRVTETRGLEQSNFLQNGIALVRAQQQARTITNDKAEQKIAALRTLALRTIDADASRDAAGALQVLEGGGYDHLFANDVQRAAAEASIDRALKQQRAFAAKAIEGEVEDHLASLQMFGRGRPGLRAKVATLGPEALAEFDEQTVWSRTYFTTTEAVRWGPPDQVQEVFENSKPQPGQEDLLQRAKLHEAARKAIEDRQNALEKDPFAYAAGNPNVTNREANIALQKAMGVDAYSFMSEAESAQRVQTFEATPDDQKAVLMAEWVQEAGKHRTALMRDLAAAGMPPAAFILLPHATDPRMLRVLDRTFAAESQGIDELTRNVEASDVRAMREGVADGLGEFRASHFAAGGERSVEFANAVQDTVELLAASYMAEGKSPSDAADLAVDQLIDNHFTFVDSYRVPAQFDADRVAAFADAARRELPNFGVAFGVDTGGPADILMEQLLDQGYWANTVDGEGLVFMTADRVPVTNGQGQFFTFRFDAAEQANIEPAPAERVDPALRLVERSRFGQPAERP